MKNSARSLMFVVIALSMCSLPACSQSSTGGSTSVKPVQMASLRPRHDLLWQRTSPSPEKPDGPVLYQLLFSAAGTANTIAKFDSNPRHLTNSDITDVNGVVSIGGLTMNGNTGAISFESTQIFPLAAGSGDISGTYPSLTVTGLQGRGISGTAPTTGQVLQFNGAQWSPATPSSAWLLGGNSGTSCTTSPCSNFLGNTDNSSLEIHVNGQRALRIEPAPSGDGSNIIGGASSNSVTAGVGGATIAGGGGISTNANSVTDDFGTVGGGLANRAGNNAGSTTDAHYATVSGGASNTASGAGSTVSGGVLNTASASFSTVAGGLSNTASGLDSFAAGCGADTNNQAGAFVWADANCGALKAATSDQFMVRATGGVIFYSNSALSIGVQLVAGGGSWSAVSDRNVKDHFAPVDSQALLARVATLPITTWNYKSQDAAIRHIGPMAQDFFSAFQVGEDDRHITEIDEGGVALAAIQGLNQKLEEDERALKQKEEEIQFLKSRLEKLEAVVTAALRSKQ